MSQFAYETSGSLTTSDSNVENGKQNATKEEYDKSDSASCIVQNSDKSNIDKASDEIVTSIPNQVIDPDLTIETNANVNNDLSTSNPVCLDKPINNYISASKLKKAQDEEIDSTLADDRSTTVTDDRTTTLAAARSTNVTDDRTTTLAADRSTTVTADRTTALAADRSTITTDDRTTALADDKSTPLDQADLKTQVTSCNAADGDIETTNYDTALESQQDKDTAKVITTDTAHVTTALNQIAEDELNKHVRSSTTADDTFETNSDTVLKSPQRENTVNIITSIDDTAPLKEDNIDVENTDTIKTGDKKKNVRPVHARKTAKRKRSQLTLKKSAKKKKYEDTSVKRKSINAQNSNLNNYNSSNKLKDNDTVDIQEKSVDDSDIEIDDIVVENGKSSDSKCKALNKRTTNTTDDINESEINFQTRGKNNRECKKGVKYFQNEEDNDNDDSSFEGKTPHDKTDIDSDGTIDLDADDSEEAIVPKKRGRPKQVEAKCEKSEVLKKKRGRPLLKGDFKCAKCDYVTNLRQSFAIHKRNCRPSLKCKYCDFTTRTMQTYMEHEAKHTKERPFKCDQCNYACRYKADLYHHRAKHLTEKIHKCPHCDFVTKWRRNIYHHLLRHTENRPYSCDLCGFSFKRIQDLKYHLYRHNEKKPIFCEKCEFRCKTNYELKCHMLKHSDERKFACTHPGCTQRVKSKSDLTKHMKTHLAVKPHSCEKCGKGFKTIACLNKHKQRHTDQRPFSCDICQRKFKVKSSLRNHIKLHTGIKPYSCDVCGHRFSNKSNMKVHIKTHEVEDRPFRCPICPHGSKTKANLLAHIGSMHGSSFAYFCELCKKPFKRYHQLDVHYTRMHTKKELDSLRSLSEFKLNVKQEIDDDDEIKEESDFIDNLEITGNIKNEIDENEFNKLLSEGSDSTEDYTEQEGPLVDVYNAASQPDAGLNSDVDISGIDHSARSEMSVRKENETTSELEIPKETITTLDTDNSESKSKSNPGDKVKDSSEDIVINGHSGDDEPINKAGAHKVSVNTDRDVPENNGNENYKADDNISETNQKNSENDNQSSKTGNETNVTVTKESNEESGTKPKTYEPYPSLFEHAPATLAMYDGFRLPLATKGFEFNLDKTGKKPRSWFMDPANIYNKDYRDHQMRYLDKQRRLYKDIKPKVSHVPKRRGRPPKRPYVEPMETPIKSEKKRKLNKTHLQNCVVSLEKMDFGKPRDSTTSTVSVETKIHEEKNLFETFNNISTGNQSNLIHENRSPEIMDDNGLIGDAFLECKAVKKENVKKVSKKVKKETTVKNETDSKLLKNTVKRKYVKTKTKSDTTDKKKTKITNTTKKTLKKVKKQTKALPMKKKGLNKKTLKIKTANSKTKTMKGKIKMKPKLKCKIIDAGLKKKRGRPSKKTNSDVTEVTTQTDFDIDIDSIKIEDTGIDYPCILISNETSQNQGRNAFSEGGIHYVIVEPKANTKLVTKSETEQSISVSSNPLFKACKKRGRPLSDVNAKGCKKPAPKAKSKGKNKVSKKLKVKIKPKDKGEKPKRKYTKKKDKAVDGNEVKEVKPPKKDKIKSQKKRIDQTGVKTTSKGKVGNRKAVTKGKGKKKTSGDEFVIEWNTQAEVEESLNSNAILESNGETNLGMVASRTGNTDVELANLDATVTGSTNVGVIDIHINTHNTTIKQEIQNGDDAGYGNGSSEIPVASIDVNPSPDVKEITFCDDITIMQRFHGSEIGMVTASDIADSGVVPNDNTDKVFETEQNLQKSKSLNHLGIIVNPLVNVCSISESSATTSDRDLQNSQPVVVSSISNGHVQSENNHQESDICFENGVNTTNIVLCKDEPPMDVEYLKNLYENK